MKKLVTLICTFTLLLSFSGCGIEKPDPDLKDGSGLKKFDIKDSRVTCDLSDRFHIDADISGTDISSLPSYELTKLNISDDQIAEMLMSGSGYKREEKKDGIVGYSKDKENLDVQLTSYVVLFHAYPNIRYSLDKGNEYFSVLSTFRPNDQASDEESKKAEELVKEKLAKLPVEYCDLTVSKVGHDKLNSFYAGLFTHADEELPEGVTEDDLYVDPITGSLDKDFKFTEEDDCYVVKGMQKIEGLPIVPEYFSGSTFTAAVSSRGIELLTIDNLLSAENPYLDSPVTSVEQAADAVYKAYETLSAKKTTDLTIDRISLSYMTQESYDEGAGQSKSFIIPVWAFHYAVRNNDGELIGYDSFKVSASDGKLLGSEGSLIAGLSSAQ